MDAITRTTEQRRVKQMDVPKFDEDVLFGKSPLGVIIERICVQRSKRLDDAIFGEINEIIKENEHLTVVDLNEKAIVEALEKQIPKRPLSISGNYYLPVCPECKQLVDDTELHCSACGQALDWSDSE